MPPNGDYLPPNFTQQTMSNVPNRPLADLVPTGQIPQEFMKNLAVKFKNVNIVFPMTNNFLFDKTKLTRFRHFNNHWLSSSGIEFWDLWFTFLFPVSSKFP